MARVVMDVLLLLPLPPPLFLKKLCGFVRIQLIVFIYRGGCDVDVDAGDDLDHLVCIAIVCRGPVALVALCVGGVVGSVSSPHFISAPQRR